MRQIRETEETARRRMAEAEASLPALIARAEAEGKASHRRALDQASAEADARRREAAVRGTAIREESNRKMDVEIARLEADVASRFEPAVAHLVERFIERHGSPLKEG